MFNDTKKVWTALGYLVFFVGLSAYLLGYLDYYSFMRLAVLVLVYSGLRVFLNHQNTTDKEKLKEAIGAMFIIILILAIPAYSKYKDLERLKTVCAYVSTWSDTPINKDPEYQKIAKICEEVLAEPDDSGDDY